MLNPPHILARLGTRTVGALLAVYLSAFLNVVLPGHTRGAVTLDGQHSVAKCCCCCGAGRSAGRAPASPGPRDREHCALCQFAVGLTSVPIVRFAVLFHGRLERAPAPPPALAERRDLVPTYLCCGPPRPIA